MGQGASAPTTYKHERSLKKPSRTAVELNLKSFSQPLDSNSKNLQHLLPQPRRAATTISGSGKPSEKLYELYSYQVEEIDELLKKIVAPLARSDLIPVEHGQISSFRNGLFNCGGNCYMNVIHQALLRVPGLKEYFFQNLHWVDINRSGRLQSTSLVGIFGEFVKVYYAFNNKLLLPNKLNQRVEQLDSRFCVNSNQSPADYLRFLLDTMCSEISTPSKEIENIPKPRHPLKRKQCRDSSYLDSERGCGKIASSIMEKSHEATTKQEESSLGHYFEELAEIHEEKRECEKVESSWVDLESQALFAFSSTLKSTNSSALSQIFTGQYLSTLTCLTCGHSTFSFEDYRVLEVPVPKREMCSLLDCLSLFSNPETVDSGFECPCCSDGRAATRTKNIWTLPPVLIVSLTRTTDHLTGRAFAKQTKSQCSVLIPETGIDLGTLLTRDVASYQERLSKSAVAVYEPLAMIHKKSYQGDGLYACSVKNAHDNKWSIFDDAQFSDLFEERYLALSSPNNSIIFLQRSSVDSIPLYTNPNNWPFQASLVKSYLPEHLWPSEFTIDNSTTENPKGKRLAPLDRDHWTSVYIKKNNSSDSEQQDKNTAKEASDKKSMKRL